MKKQLWLIGAGYMAKEYIKVLNALNASFLVVGRGQMRVKELKDEYNIDAIDGGLLHYLTSNPVIPEYAIIAVSCEELYITTLNLIKAGVKNILVEKPGGLSSAEIKELDSISGITGTNLVIAYNRRFYKSVEFLRNMIKEDGGIRSVNFEFTEWIHTIDINKFPLQVLQKFLIANSSHVIDTVFHLAGRPVKLNCSVYGNEVSWHPSGSIFSGSGITDRNVVFSYASNWGAPGRWAIEILTSKRRYYLKPLERLAIQEKGSVVINEYNGDYSIDIDYKPGLYNLVNAFICKNSKLLCGINEHFQNFDLYEQIGNYS